MRLWSVHPRYLDRQGLLACWREGLLAQSVLLFDGRGYRNHPQLERFREQEAPERAIAAFLSGIAAEADARGYSFTHSKIVSPAEGAPLIPVTTGQLSYEWSHLLAKLERRTPALAEEFAGIAMPETHPLFVSGDGEIASWERPLP